MEREIKFRAWSTMNGIMYDPMPIIDFPIMKINANILMQFTGFKDKTGREIYEGDILQGYDGNPKAPKFTVTFEHGCFCWGGEPLGYDFESHDVDGNPEKSNPSKWATIVGNIYENK